MTKYSKVAERHTSNPGLRIDWLAGVFCSNILIHVGGWRFLCVLSVCTLSCILETMLVAVVISCRSVVHCAAASLPSFQLVWLVPTRVTNSVRSGLHFNYKQTVSNSLIESGPLLAKYGCVPRLRVSKMLNKFIINVGIDTLGKRATHVDSLLKQ